MKIKKIGLLCLALVLAMGALGVGFAMWSDTIYIKGIVQTGTVDVQFSNQRSNDSFTTPPDLSTGDPALPGSWTHADLDTPMTWTWAGDVNMPASKEVGSIDCTITTDCATNDTLNVTIADGYPSYFGGIGFTIDNMGTVPVKVDTIQLTSIGGVAITPVNLTAGTYYYVDHETKTVDTSLDVNNDDYCIVISELAHGQQIGAYGWPDDALFGDIAIHVEQAAKENDDANYPVGGYKFTIGIKCSQWNEVT